MTQRASPSRCLDRERDRAVSGRGWGGRACAWPGAAPIPPPPIPNRGVPGASAGGYGAGDPAGGEAAARTPAPHRRGPDRGISFVHFRQGGVERWQLVGLITQRSRVRIPPPLPQYETAWDTVPGGFFMP